MQHERIKLPYEMKALEPFISEETLYYHYDKHHKKYADTLNELIKGTNFENMTLMDIIKQAQGPTFNNAAQVFNHNFYWLGLNTNKTHASLELKTMIEKDFGSVQELQDEFLDKAAKNFGSGWTWLVLNGQKLEVMNTSNADNPIKHDLVPLLTCDVWEHAYYIDYRNARPQYLQKWWEVINWNFVSQNLAEAMSSKDTYIELCNYDSDICDYLDRFYKGEQVET